MADNAAAPTPKTEVPSSPTPGRGKPSSGWTSHGHWYGPGEPDMATKPVAVTRCGGPGLCSKCSTTVAGRWPASIVEAAGWRAPSDPAVSPGTYRVGRKVGRTIYRVVGDEPSDADELIGTMDTRELAALAVRGMNAFSADLARDPLADPVAWVDRHAGTSLLSYRMRELEKALDEVLRHFTEYGHPRSVRSDWISEDTVNHWRAVLDRRGPRR